MALAWFGVCIVLFALVPMNQPFFGSIFVSFFRALGRLNLQFPQRFFMDLSFELIALGVYLVIGVLFLRLFVRLPRALEISLAAFMGIGLANFALEIPAIFLFLNRFSVAMILGLLLLGLIAARRLAGWSELAPEFGSPPLDRPAERWAFAAAWALMAAIVLLSFYHALLYPVDYWDALILYVHYGEMTWRLGGFPTLVCLQVGLGLGANYPHLYPLHQAATAALFGSWSDLYAQLLPPLAGVVSIVTVYYLSLHLTRDRLASALAALAFRALPFVSSYFVYASDYSLVMAYTAAFLLFAALFASHPTVRAAQPLLMTAAIFLHINYLGVVVWPCVALLIVWMMLTRECGRRLGAAWIASACGWFALAMTWCMRNAIVTGNPVYAFFPNLFGGKNINLDVLASANTEWLAHGNGFAQLGDTLGQRLVGSVPVMLFDWRMAPLTLGLLAPALLFGWKKNQPFYWTALLLLFIYALYQYVISGLYLYHTIAAFVILAVFAARFLAVTSGAARLGFAALVLFTGLIPGVSYSIMGPKIANPSLPVFATPGLSKEQYYRVRYPEVAPAWKFINDTLEPYSLILTHDNRYHVYREDIGIIHLDDCELTPFYGRPYDEVHRELLRRGVSYYLYIPDEDTHPITARLGHRAHLNDPAYFDEIYRNGRVALYRLIKPEE
ncbi:MAG: hypothetical protein GC154_12610 [bacterium]|nr:hypothetical protein [bacterium]